jgi:sterol desaturase/sphingolipid hydroxylase (fatty acid hydroxylase superfamily)
MRLSKAAYFADFVVYPPVIAILLTAALRPESLVCRKTAAVCVVSGLVLWTLVEYGMHRFVLHQIPYLADMHEAHHDDPTGFVGTPTWLSLAMIGCGALLPLWWEAGVGLATAFTAGIAIGYLCYVGVHHVVHHWRIAPATYLYWLNRRHALHHHAPLPCNFGVTTGVWDWMFGTAFPGANRACPSEAALDGSFRGSDDSHHAP